MKCWLIEIGADVFINAVSIPEYQDQGNEDSKNENPLHVESMTAETFPSIAIADFGGVRHYLNEK